MALQVDCPCCGRRTVFSPENRWRPFCSQRCRHASEALRPLADSQRSLLVEWTALWLTRGQTLPSARAAEKRGAEFMQQ